MESVEIKRLRGRLAAEAAFLKHVKHYGDVSYQLDEFENFAYVYVPDFPIGEQYGGPCCQDRKTCWNKSYFPPFHRL
jgi:hypothetical protein